MKTAVPPDQLLVYNGSKAGNRFASSLRDIPSCSFPHTNAGGSTVKEIHAIQNILGLPNIAREAVISLSLLVLVLAVIVYFVVNTIY